MNYTYIQSISTEGDGGDEQRIDIFDTRANSAGTNAYSLKNELKWIVLMAFSATQKHCFGYFYVIDHIYICV